MGVRDAGLAAAGRLAVRFHDPADALAEVPGTLVATRLDLQAPLENAWALKAAWPTAELKVVDDAGHGATAGVAAALRRATDGYAG